MKKLNRLLSDIRLYMPVALEVGAKQELSPEQHHRLKNVMRLQAGDSIICFDGIAEYTAEFTSSKKSGFLTCLHKTKDAQPNPLKIRLVQALCKSKNMETILQKATELGVDSIIPLQSRYSSMSLQQARNKLDHWSKILVSASEQSGRIALPELAQPVEFSSYCNNFSTEKHGLGLLFDHQAKGVDLPKTATNISIVTIAIGPEGGWHQQEVDLAVQQGFLPQRWGQTIWRVETAAIVATSVIQYHFGGFRS